MDSTLVESSIKRSEFLRVSNFKTCEIMYCKFINQVIHITQTNFQDFKISDLPPLRFEEIERIYYLCLSDKESQRKAKEEIEINLEKALNITKELKSKYFEIRDKFEPCEKEKNSSDIEFWEGKRNEIYNLGIELRFFISDCFDLKLKFYPETFQKPNRIKLMEYYIPVINENRKKFESDIL